MKKLVSLFLAALMLFAVVPAGALSKEASKAEEGMQMIETDLPSGIYDDGRTLIIHPEDGDMVFEYDPEAEQAEENADMRNLTEPMILPSVFDINADVIDWSEMPVVQENGFLAPIDPPTDGAIAVSTAKQLYDIRNNPNGNYYLTQDIDVADLVDLGLSWETIPSYSGIFDGQGHSIGVLPDALFGTARGTITNLSLTVNIENDNYTYDSVGAIAQLNYATINNCVSKGHIAVNKTAGGMIGCGGLVNQVFINCINYTVVTCSDYAGGILGRSTDYQCALTFTNCLNNAEINGATAGGIIGGAEARYKSVLFNNCNNKASITGSTAGGIAGQLVAGMRPTFTNCANSGTITAKAIAGGLVGNYSNSYVYNTEFNNCANYAAVIASASAGGIVGRLGRKTSDDDERIIFTNCVNFAVVKAIAQSSSSQSICAGGIIGEKPLDIWGPVYFINCRNHAEIMVESNGGSAGCGGIVGSNNYDTSNSQYRHATYFTHCINTASITAMGAEKIYIGGIAAGGRSFTDCCSTVDIKASASGAVYSGGIAGQGNDFENCYFRGEVEAISETENAYAGGMTGYSSSGSTMRRLRVISSEIYAESGGESKFAYAGGIAGYVNGSCGIGYCVASNAGSTALDSWYAFNSSLIGYVVGALNFTDTCAYSNLGGYAEYFGSQTGNENAYSYTGLLNGNFANYTFKVTDSHTGCAIGGAVINCDGITAVTNSNGYATMVLPINVILQVTASKTFYAEKTEYAVKLDSNSIKEIQLDYVYTGSGGSGTGYITVGGHTIGYPSRYGGTVTATGPNTTVRGETSPAFTLELGVDLPHGTLSAKVDAEKKTIEVLLNPVEFESGDSGFENKWKRANDTIAKLLSGKDMEKWKKEFRESEAKFGFSCKVTHGGYALLSYADGSLKVVEGGYAIGFKAKYAFPKVPLWGIVYFQLKLEAGLNGKAFLSIDQNDVFCFNSTCSASFAIRGGVGASILLGLLKAEGGLEAKGTLTINEPFISMQESLSAKVDLSLYAEIRAILWSVKPSFTFFTYQIWPRSKDVPTIDLTPYMNNDAMELMPRGYLKETAMTRAIGDETLTMNSVFPYGEPQIVQLDDGRLVLVWVHDDGSRTDENRTALYYSVCDNGVWSTPAIVWDDGTGDVSPVIAADGNNVHIVWQNMSEVFPEGSDLDYALTRTQLCYTKLNWDGSIDEPTVIDAAGKYQGKICMAADNGSAVVAWMENSANNIWNETGTYSVYRRTMTAGSWSSQSTVASGKTIVSEVACGYIDGTPNVAYVLDVDGNATTTTDLDVYKYVGSSTTRVTNNSVPDTNIQYVNNDLYWRQENELRNASGLLGLVSEDDLMLAKAPDGSLVAVIKSVVDGFNTELYGSFMNTTTGEWSVPAPITNYYGAIRSYSPIVCADGSIAIALDNAELQEIEEDGDEAYGTTSMHVIVGSSLTDLIVTEGMTYDVDAVVPGEDLDMTVTVYNNSINAVNGVDAEFYDEDGTLVYTAHSNETVECGEEKELTFTYPVPAQLALTTYTVKIVPAGIDDDIPDNNETEVTIGYADLALENGEFIRTENGARIEADITNIGFDTAENAAVTLCYQGVDGDVLGSVELGDMTVSAAQHVSFNVPAAYLHNEDELDLNTFYMYVETDTPEAHASNNSDVIVDEPIRVTSITLDILQHDMLVHDTLQLTAAAEPAEAANQLIMWASTNVDVVTVDENGLVTAVGEGSAIVYAITADGIYSEGCYINTEYPYYTVTFQYEDGTVIDTQQIKETYDATPPEVMEIEGYTFAGWDGDYTNVQGDIVLTAQYEVITYHVFYYINGEVYHVDEYPYNAEITPLDEPEIEGYTFMGWDYIPDTMPAEDVIVTGETEINSYYLTYFVDGERYQRFSYVYGTPITPLEEPVREGYDFSGWSEIPETMPAHSVAVHGSFSVTTFTVTFVDWDGTVIDVQTVDIWNDATAPADPAREGWTFTGWDTDFTNVTADITVTATYTINTYTVIFADWDGTVIDVQYVTYGSSAAAPADPEREGYTFIGWDVDFTNVSGDITVTAQYILNANNRYYEKVTLGTLTSGYYVLYGVNGDYCGAMNNAIANNRMGVTGVDFEDGQIKNPDENAVWYINVDGNGVITLYSEASAQYVEITANSASGFRLVSESTCGYTYEYDDIEETFILKTTSETGNERCISIYQTDFRCYAESGVKPLYLYRYVSSNMHTVTFLDWDGTVLSVQQVEDGQDAVPPERPSRPGYTFVGWDTDYTNVTEDLVINAVFEENIHYDIIGDANFDGVLGFADVAALYGMILTGGTLTPEQQYVCDVNGDGYVSFADVAALYNYVLTGE